MDYIVGHSGSLGQNRHPIGEPCCSRPPSPEKSHLSFQTFPLIYPGPTLLPLLHTSPVIVFSSFLLQLFGLLGPPLWATLSGHCSQDELAVPAAVLPGLTRAVLGTSYSSALRCPHQARLSPNGMAA
jgi:hypothetical protein